MNGYVLDGRALSLGEAEQDKVNKAVFQRGQNILRGIILKKEEDKKYDAGSHVLSPS